MNRKMIRISGLLSLVLLAFALQACQMTTTRVVQQGFQASDDRVKFLYHESPGDNRGIIECRVAEDGELYDCRDLNLVFEGDE